MKKAPNHFTLRQLFDLCNSVHRQTGDGRWVSARPIGLFSLWWRLKLAWKVFLGHYDTIEWDET